MAQIILQIPDALIPRIRRAFGSDSKLATLAEIRAIFISQIKQRLLTIESEDAKEQLRNSVEQENWTQP